MITNELGRAISLLIAMPVLMTAQPARYRDPVMLKSWAAPLYWQPAEAERALSATPRVATANSPMGSSALVFVAMTPCRIADTRASQNFPANFGAPSLVGNAPARTFLIQANTTCPVPSIAQAYSFNLTIVAPAPYGFITAYPTPGPMPLAATVDWATSLIVGNAAVVPGGVNGMVDVFASANTDLVIDINGYYAAPGDLHANTAIGTGALAGDTIGAGNTAAGANALAANSTGNFNTAVGQLALQDNTSGGGNTAIGQMALQANTTGNANTASGGSALAHNTTGFNNTADGDGALAANTIGVFNTADGQGAMQTNTTGGYNTACGAGALAANTTGTTNIAIGAMAAQYVAGTGSNNIHIGSSGSLNDSGVIRIGSTQSSFYAAGIRGVTTGSSNAVPVVIDSSGQLGTVNSSRRFKEDIHDMGEASSGLLRLRPVTFRYRQPFADGSKPVEYGLIAEEVAEVYPDLVAHSADGQIETVKYQVLDSMLLNELQKEHAQARQQADEIRLLRTRLAALEQLLSGKAAEAIQPGE
jgi:hypothetical protein